jgi:hypothetical protein
LSFYFFSISHRRFFHHHVEVLISMLVSELLFRLRLCNILTEKLVLLSQLHRSPYFSSLVGSLSSLNRLFVSELVVHCKDA